MAHFIDTVKFIILIENQVVVTHAFNPITQEPDPDGSL